MTPTSRKEALQRIQRVWNSSPPRRDRIAKIPVIEADIEVDGNVAMCNETRCRGRLLLYSISIADKQGWAPAAGDTAEALTKPNSTRAWLRDSEAARINTKDHARPHSNPNTGLRRRRRCFGLERSHHADEGSVAGA